jgi:hypothetical protein
VWHTVNLQLQQSGRAGYEISAPPQISAFGRGYCRAAGDIANRESASVSVAPVRIIVGFPPGGPNAVRQKTESLSR